MHQGIPFCPPHEHNSLHMVIYVGYSCFNCCTAVTPIWVEPDLLASPVPGASTCTPPSPHTARLTSERSSTKHCLSSSSFNQETSCRLNCEVVMHAGPHLRPARETAVRWGRRMVQLAPYHAYIDTYLLIFSPIRLFHVCILSVVASRVHGASGWRIGCTATDRLGSR